MPSEYDILFEEPQTGSEYDLLLAPSAPVEQVPGELAFPIEGGGIQKVELSDPRISPSEREESWNTLDGNITPEFARDFMLLAAGAVNARSLKYNTGKEEIPVETPRQVFDAAVQNQLLAPSFDADPKFGAFKSHWDQYKTEMDPSMLGAAGRGAVSAIGSTVGSTVGAGLASPAGLAGVALGGIGGGMAGAALQESIFPQTSKDIAQRMFDESRDSTRRSRLAGELAPSLATLKPIFIGPNNAVASIASGQMPRQVLNFSGSTLGNIDVAAARRIGAGALIGGAIPAAIDVYKNKDIDAERVFQGVLAGGALEGNSLGKVLFDRLATTTKNALEIRNRVFQHNVPESGRTNAIFRLQEAANVNKNGVQLMSGDLVRGMLTRMQRVLGARDPQISARSEANEAAIAMNLAKELAPEGAPSTATRAYAEQWQKNLLDEADQAYNALSTAGETQYASIMEAAMEQSAAAYAAREQGIVNAELAEAMILRNLDAAVANIKLRAGIREPAAKAVRNILTKEGDVVIKAASKLYETPKTSAAKTTFSNTYQALKWTQTSQGFGESAKKDPSIAPRIVSRLLKLRKPSFTPKGKKLHERPVAELIADYRTINQAISEAATDNKDNTVRVLMKVREGMQKDLDAAGKVWPELQEANKAWTEAMKIYGDGEIGKVIDSRNAIPTPETLDKIFKGKSGTQDLSAAQQLRLALKERPDGLDAVKDWFVHRLALKGGKTSETMSEWLNRPEQVEALNSFPEARTALEEHVREIRDAELSAAGAKAAVKTAEAVPKIGKDHVPDSVKKIADQQRDAFLAAAKDRQTELRNETNNNAFAKFAGVLPDKAIEGILASGDPVQAMQQAVQVAEQDPSGNAVQGLRNSFRSFLNKSVELNGRPLSKDNQPDMPLAPGELALSLSKLNQFMKSTSPMRPVIEAAYGPESVELKALDLAREQMEAWSRTQKISPGSSPTMDLDSLKNAMEGQVEENLLSFISKAGRGFSTKNYAFNRIAWLGDIYSAVYHRGLEQMVERFQVEAMLNPNLAIEALLPLRPENMPRINAVLKNYFVSKDQLYKEVPELPFSAQNTKEETLGEGKFLRDKVTGYSIQAVGGKYRTFDQKGRQLGVSDTIQAAKDKAVAEDIKKLPPLKPRK